MLEIIVVIACVWLFFKAVGLGFRIAWGAAKIAASVLLALALPLLIVCLVFTGGVMLLLPLALIGAAAGLLRACI